jgi:hypothetical protein
VGFRGADAMNGRTAWSRTPVPRSADRTYLAVAILADTLLADISLLHDTGGPLRSVVVFIFWILGPGVAVTGFLTLNDVARELVIAPPLSIFLGGIPAMMALSGAWDTHTTLVCTTTLAAVVLGLGLLRDAVIRRHQRWSERPERHTGLTKAAVSGRDSSHGLGGADESKTSPESAVVATADIPQGKTPERPEIQGDVQTSLTTDSEASPAGTGSRSAPRADLLIGDEVLPRVSMVLLVGTVVLILLAAGGVILVVRGVG